MKRKSYLVLTCIAIAFVAICCGILFYTGIPGSVSERSRCGKRLAEVFGFREVATYHHSGVVMKKEVFRGIPVWSGGELLLGQTESASNLVTGDYYDPQGRKVSSIRNGRGVKVLFYPDGLPHMIAFYQDGHLADHTVVWDWDGGRVQSLSFGDPKANTREIWGFFTNGTKWFESKYETGILVASTEWRKDGTIESRTHTSIRDVHVDTNNKISSVTNCAYNTSDE